MTDAEFLRALAYKFERWSFPQYGNRLRAIALDHERMERELTRLMQDGGPRSGPECRAREAGREASAAMEELKG